MRDTVLAVYMANTIGLMLMVAVLTLIIGVCTAWLSVHYEFPLRGLLVPALALPLAAPAYVIGYVYADLLEFSGPIQESLRSLLDLAPQTHLLPSIRSLPGAALVIALVLYPYVYLLARGRFVQQMQVFSSGLPIAALADPCRSFFFLVIY